MKALTQLLAALLRAFNSPAELSPDGKRLKGLPIVYRGNDKLPYGVTATRKKKPIKGLIIHHPASAKGAGVAGLISYINKPRPPKGYMFGYHFVIDTDGTIYQAAPFTKRTNHIQGSSYRTSAKHLTNVNTIGISFHQASHNPGMAPNAKQTKAGRQLVRALRQVYGPLDIFGHGEIQSDKQPNEGLAFARLARGDGK